MIFKKLLFCLCISFGQLMSAAVCEISCEDASNCLWKLNNSARSENPFPLDRYISFDYDSIQKKIAALRFWNEVDVFSDPEPYKKKQDLTSDALERWNTSYRTKIAFHKGSIFFIGTNGLHILQNGKKSLLYCIAMDDCQFSFCQQNSNLLRVDLGYGYSRQLSFEWDESLNQLHSSDYCEPEKYFKGNKDESAVVSFDESKKDFCINNTNEKPLVEEEFDSLKIYKKNKKKRSIEKSDEGKENSKDFFHLILTSCKSI